MSGRGYGAGPNGGGYDSAIVWQEIPFPEPYLVQYLSEYDRLVVPVHGRPSGCPNPQCVWGYAHADACDGVPF